MDDKAWALLVGKIDAIERKVDSLIEFKGWVLGAACISGGVGYLLFEWALV